MAVSHTKAKILDAAEELFATNGFSATSLRTVIAAAGVNLAAVHYHFGSKERLIEAVFARRLGPLNARRLELLDQEQERAGEGPLAVEPILATLIDPVVELALQGAGKTSRVATLFGRVHNDPDQRVRELLLEQFGTVRRRYLAALAASLPELSREELAVRFHLAIGAMAAAFAEPKRLEQISDGAVRGSDAPLLAGYLLPFLVAALRAPAAPVRTTHCRSASPALPRARRSSASKREPSR